MRADLKSYLPMEPNINLNRNIKKTSLQNFATNAKPKYVDHHTESHPSLKYAVGRNPVTGNIAAILPHELPDVELSPNNKLLRDQKNKDPYDAETTQYLEHMRSIGRFKEQIHEYKDSVLAGAHNRKKSPPNKKSRVQSQQPAVATSKPSVPALKSSMSLAN